MSYSVDFKNVSTVGLESSPVAEALAGLRANEARYFMNKYKHEFTVVPASESQDSLEYVNRILKEERDIEFAAKPLETSAFQVENIRFSYVFYEDGLALNVM
ncbi:phage tail protein, partial [Bacillus subtilis]|uniref:phage tail protein n=1 Tax=Bacillus subtilis TaxID=1423 RepID=UPI003F7B806B